MQSAHSKSGLYRLQRLLPVSRCVSNIDVVAPQQPNLHSQLLPFTAGRSCNHTHCLMEESHSRATRVVCMHGMCVLATAAAAGRRRVHVGRCDDAAGAISVVTARQWIQVVRGAHGICPEPFHKAVYCNTWPWYFFFQVVSCCSETCTRLLVAVFMQPHSCTLPSASVEPFLGCFRLAEAFASARLLHSKLTLARV
jgi:hypothetical protein